MKTMLRIAATFILFSFIDTVHAGDPWIIDPHTHFKGEMQIALERKTMQRDPRDSLGHVVKPEDYREIADRLDIQSTLVVEAVEQEQPQFNDWILGQTNCDLVCGYVARGDLSSPDFLEHYKRYKQSGYLNGYRLRLEELSGYLTNDTAAQHLRKLEADGMVVDLLVEPKHSVDVVVLARTYPKLKIVINHCFRARMVDGQIDDEWKQAVTDCAAFPNVQMKISSILNFASTMPFNESAPTDLAYYRPVLDHCFDAFGEDRVIFATNWGVSAHYGKVDDVVRIVKEFLSTKGESAVKKGMRENAIKVYGIPTKHLR